MKKEVPSSGLMIAFVVLWNLGVLFVIEGLTLRIPGALGKDEIPGPVRIFLGIIVSLSALLVFFRHYVLGVRALGFKILLPVLAFLAVTLVGTAAFLPGLAQIPYPDAARLILRLWIIHLATGVVMLKWIKAVSRN